MLRTSTALLLMLALSACGTPAKKPEAPTQGRATLKVMTYNVNYGLAGDPATIDAIRSQDADVILLQETTAAWEHVLRERLTREYPHMEFKHCCGAGGLAVLSRHAFSPQEYIPAPKPGWFPAWRVVFETPLGRVQALNVHLRPPVSDGGSFVRGYFSTPSIRKREIAAYVKHLDASIPTIVAGDFNEGASGSAVAFLEGRGFATALPEFHPGEDTWRWTTSVGTVRSQLDHVVYDHKRLRALDAFVVQKGRSDHLPVVAIFELAQ